MSQSLSFAAEGLAQLAHAGQTRRGGAPYITHPMAVADLVSWRLHPIALLHDAVEDADNAPAVMAVLTLFPEYVVEAVLALTHSPHEDYFATYLPRVKANPDALVVKLADIASNLRDAPTARQKDKYSRAIAYLRAP